MNCATVSKKLEVTKMLCSGTIAERATESLSDLDKTNGGMLYGVAKHATHLMLETYCKILDKILCGCSFQIFMVRLIRQETL